MGLCLEKSRNFEKAKWDMSEITVSIGAQMRLRWRSVKEWEMNKWEYGVAKNGDGGAPYPATGSASTAAVRDRQ